VPRNADLCFVAFYESPTIVEFCPTFKTRGISFKSRKSVSEDSPSPDPEISSITLLIQRTRGGCDSSRDRVFRELQGFLEATALKYGDGRTSNKYGKSDIVQQSFVKAIERFETFRGQTSPEFRAWLKQLVINEIRQTNRNLHRKVRDVSREKPMDSPATSPREEFQAVDPTPGTQAIKNEQITHMRLAIAQLPENYRRVIEAKSFEHKTLTEIASEMDRSVEATTKLWYRAVVKLQQLMASADEQKTT